MSDFDSAVEKATRLFGEMSQHDHDIAAIFYSSAIASMQGESLGWVWIIQHEPTGQIVNHGFSFDEIDDEAGKPAGLVFKARKVFTYPPSAASKIAEQDARIKELEQQLEVVRKDAEGKVSVPIEPTDEIAEAFQKAMLKEFGMQTTLGYHKRIYKSMLDAAIRQIGGAE